jgi:steroid Delta-isomerase
MMTVSASLPETIQSTVQQYFAASRSPNPVAAMVACFAQNCQVYEPAEAQPLQGQAELRDFLQGMVSQFKSIGLTAEFTSINGNQAAVQWTGRGISLAGREITFSGIDLFEFNNLGQIQVLRGYWNPALMLAELQSDR